MHRCKGNKGNKEPKQANTQTKQNQTKPKTATKHHTQTKPLQRVKQVRHSSHGTSETGAMRHLSQASYAAPRARMAGELLTRKLSCLMGRSSQRPRRTKPNKNNTPTQTHKQKPPIRSAHLITIYAQGVWAATVRRT